MGGLYGVSIGGAFFGESMFSHGRDASKAALVALVQRLHAGGYLPLAPPLVPPHLKVFAVVGVTRGRHQRHTQLPLCATPLL